MSSYEESPTPCVRMCALPDHLELNETAHWNKRTIKWCITGTLPGIADADQKAAYEWAWQQWASVANIQPVYTETARDADVRMGSGLIDGRGGTLAWSELPSGADTPLQQKYDTGDQWCVAEQPPSNLIDLARVACHEIGHALGLGHDAAGSDALMAPVYSLQIRAPRPRDIQRIQQLYGAAAPVPTPAPAPPAPTPVPTPTPTPPAGLMTPEQALAAMALILSQAGYTVTRNH